MNHIYRSIWNDKTGTFVAVSENAKSGGRKASTGASIAVGTGFALKVLAVSLMLGFGSTSYALPVGGVVAAGSASVTSGNGSMTVNQSSQNVVLNWQSFNIGAAEAVRFVQPNSSAVALNRVIGADPSSILGSLSANGKVFLVNPNGILFGKGASVNVGGLVASTLNISDSDFMAGNYKFAGAGTGSVLNQGSINADGGYVALLGANVSNEGIINARLGSVALAAGNAITLDVVGDGLLNVAVNEGAVNALVHNGGMIQADGGQVLLTAQAAGNLLQTAVNNTGVIQAQSIENHDGVIKLLGDMQSGTVHVGGTLDASAPDGGNGGFIETSAAHVKVGNGARITTAAAQGLTGSWLIDPTDYTIAVTGGDITGAALSTNLGSTNVTILSTSGASGSNGDVNVNDSVTWSANKLTLNAQNNININTAMQGSGSASLALEYGQAAVASGNTSKVNIKAPVNLPAGNSLSTKLGSDGAVLNYTVLTSLGAAGSTTGTDLQGMNGNKTGLYALGANIDAAATSGWNAGAGFLPVGDNTTNFTGAFDGLGHTISNLTINRAVNYVGLFGYTNGSTIQNIGLVGGNTSGTSNVGALVGYNQGLIDNSYATGNVTSTGATAGGLVGYSSNHTISNSHATGNVSAAGSAGGLMGAGAGNTISNSYATGNVNSTYIFNGGLIGSSSDTITYSYATGTVTGTNNTGGLVGSQGGGSITDSYATGTVTGTVNVGGLLGYLAASASATRTYSIGAVSGTSGVFGLIGKRVGTVTNSYWDTTTSGQASSSGAIGLTTVQMQTASNFTGFNFTTTAGASGNNWVMVDVDGTLNNTGGALGGTRPMLASEYSTTINNAHQLQLMSMNLAGKYTVGQNITAAATGTTNDVWSGSTFIPVGNNSTLFTGTFNGLGHTISNLTINMPSTYYVGLFGANGGLIQNIGLIGGSVTGSYYAGGLVGNNANSNALITNSYNTGSVSGSSYLGGIAGQNWSGAVTNSYATGNITGTGTNIGGLVGYGHNSAAVNNSYATGNVVGANAVGGLMGSMNKNSVINNSYATGSVASSAQYSGGLIGVISSGAGVSNSYATGAVNGATQVGGLIGTVSNGTSASNSYATGAVNGVTQVGGLIGLADNTTSASNSYSTGAVTGGSEVGGLIGATGFHAGAAGASNSYWDKQTSGQTTSAGGVGATGLQTAEMKTSSSFSGLDFANIWVIYDTHTNPLLRSFMTALTVTANNATKTYDSIGYNGGNGVTYTVVPDANLLGSLSYSGSAQGAVNAGSYVITPGGFYSTSQQGYAISYVNGALTVNAANLTLATSNVSKTYDGGLTAAGTATVTSGTLFGSDSLSGGTFAFTDKNVGSGTKTVTTSGVTVSDGNSGGNYNVTYANNTASTITRLGSVTWVGAATGNWFDPANWAGGAVPDLANVANVIIPGSVLVSFNNASAVSPAQAGTVNVDSIGSAGGLSLADGSLNVANGVQLARLDQSGGTLNSSTINVGSVTQSGGTLTSSGDFTVTDAYGQSSSGASVNVGGNATITQNSGSAVLGNITTAGTLGVTAVSGNITQLAGTSIVSNGGGTLTAPNGNVALAGSGNTLGAVIISDGSSLATPSSGAKDTRLQNAVAGTISMNSVNTLEGNADASPSVLGQPLRRLPSGSSASGVLEGLNVTLVGQGVKLPSGVQAGDSKDDAN